MGESSSVPFPGDTPNFHRTAQQCSNTTGYSNAEDAQVSSEGIRSSSAAGNELLLPLNAIRLCPIQYQTRSLAYSITDKGNVCIRSMRSGAGGRNSDSGAPEHRARDKAISEIMEISTNGMEVSRKFCMSSA